jgi:hypothetical protein
MRDYGPASVVRADDHGRALAGVSGAHRRNVTDRLSFPGNMWTLIVIPCMRWAHGLHGGYRSIPKRFGYSSPGPRLRRPRRFGHSWPASHS